MCVFYNVLIVFFSGGQIGHCDNNVDLGVLAAAESGFT